MAGNAAIWFLPKPFGDIEEIDLGEPLSDLQRTVMVSEVSAEAINGRISTVRLAARTRVRVLIERFVDPVLARKLRTLENHLQRGGVMAIAEDKDKAVAAFIEATPDRGDNGFVLQGRPFPFNPSAALEVGDFVTVQSPSPKYLYEEQEMALALPIGSNLVALSLLTFDYTGEPWALFRHRGFWPVMQVPLASRASTFLTHDHRISWTFDLLLEESQPMLESAASHPELAIITGNVDPQRGWTFDPNWNTPPFETPSSSNGGAAG